jgi:ketosteroid isomerase-like protein
MTNGQIDDVRRAYDALAQGDLSTATANWADDVEWVEAESTSLPQGASYSGRQSVRQAIEEIMGNFDGFQIKADEFIEAEGGQVVVIGRTSGRAKSTGATLNSPFILMCEMDDGTVTRIRTFGTAGEMTRTLQQST